MKRTTLRLIPFLFLGLLSCSHPATVYHEIDLSKKWTKEEHFSLSEIAKTIKYIPLETDRACFFAANRCGLLVSDNYFYVVPRNKPLLIFSKSGEFRDSVGSIGEGPGEVTTIESVVVNEKNEWIAVFNPAHASVLLHSYDGGIKKIRSKKELGR